MKKLLLLPLCLLISLKGLSQTSLSIQALLNDSLGGGNGNACSFSVNPPYYSSNEMEATATGYSLMTDTFLLTCLFGDGLMQTSIACYGNGTMYQLTGTNQLIMHAYFSHTYLSVGIYDVTYIVTAPDGNTDTLVCPAENIYGGTCANFTSYCYLDNNSNCAYDVGEQLVYNVPLTLVNGSSFYAQYYNGAFNEDIHATLNYTAQIDIAYLQSLGYAITCGSGLVNFTANASSNVIYFGVGCPAVFDVGVYSSGYGFKLGNSATVLSGIKVKTCTATTGSYDLTLDPKLTFVTAIVPPASGSGLNYTWNYNNMQSFNNSVAYNALYFNLTASAQIGDTVCYTFALPASFIDDDLTNNSVTVCYPVKAAWDPNMKEVSPKGIGAAGLISQGTELTYTIFFQNTGNDTAKNVYLLDALDSDFNINSLEMLQSSHAMNLYILNGNVLKFDFRNINLPDSNVNESASHGYVVYRIKPQSNLTNGTTLTNNAAIYFDSNPPVITNTTLNTISIPLGLSEETFSQIRVYPNPVSDKLFIEADFKYKGLLLLTDMAGKIIVRTTIESKTAELNTSKLQKGIYLLHLQSELSNVVKKIIVD